MTLNEAKELVETIHRRARIVNPLTGTVIGFTVKNKQSKTTKRNKVRKHTPLQNLTKGTVVGALLRKK